jgi:hypothetical protein
MDSDQDLLTEGFPHSEIRGSTIARISPRLIAACHVLHRLLAPRHPPNALFSLHHTTTARAQGQTAPHQVTQTAIACTHNYRDTTLGRRAAELIRNHTHINQIRFTLRKNKPRQAPRKRLSQEAGARPVRKPSGFFVPSRSSGTHQHP